MGKLPELADLIPVLKGTFFEYAKYPFAKMLSTQVPEHGLIRHGFRVYEVGEHVQNLDAFKLRPFSCILTEDELMILSEQKLKRRP